MKNGPGKALFHARGREMYFAFLLYKLELTLKLKLIRFTGQVVKFKPHIAWKHKTQIRQGSCS